MLCGCGCKQCVFIWCTLWCSDPGGGCCVCVNCVYMRPTVRCSDAEHCTVLLWRLLCLCKQSVYIRLTVQCSDPGYRLFVFM